VVKWLLGKGTLLTNRVLLYSALEMEFTELPLTRNVKCPVCGDQPSIQALREDTYTMNQTCESR